MREHINSLGQVSRQLKEKRSEGSPWQQKAIDQIDPLLREMAINLSAKSITFNEQQSQVHMPAYREYVHSKLRTGIENRKTNSRLRGL